MDNIWKDVPGYPLYEVSSDGTIRTKRRIARNRHSSWEIGPHIRKTMIGTTGYKCFTISVSGRTKMMKIHRLVAQAFIPNPDNKPQVNHINGIKTDNRVENLEWCTSGENHRHARKNGLYHPAKGPDTAKAKLIDSDIYTIIGLHEGGASQRQIAYEMCISRRNVRSILSEQTWKHLPRTTKEP